MPLVDAGGALRSAGARADSRAAETAAILCSVFDGSPVGLAYLDRDLRFVRIKLGARRHERARGRGAPRPPARRGAAPTYPEDLLAVLHRGNETGEPVVDHEASGARRSAPGRPAARPGTPTSFSARHKAACERLLDRLEREARGYGWCGCAPR